MQMPDELSGRHPNTLHVFQFFAFDHLPEPLRSVSEPSYHLARAMINSLPDGLELEAGLRKLLEAKDCFVRSALPLMPPPPRSESSDG